MQGNFSQDQEESFDRIEEIFEDSASRSSLLLLTDRHLMCQFFAELVFTFII